MYKHLNIPIILTYFKAFETYPGRSLHPISLDYVREYPPESYHSYLIISHSEMNTYLYTYDSTSYPQYEWTSRDNYLILTILHSSWHAGGTTDMYGSTFLNLWTKYQVLNVITIVKYMDICNKQSDIMVYDFFETNGVINVTPEQVAELPRSYLERTWNLKGYSVRVTMLHSFPNAVFNCRSLKKCSYEGRDWEVLRNLATYMNFTPVISQPRDGKGLGYKTESVFTGSLGDLVYKRVDISANERYIKDYDADIEFTMPAFYTQQLVVIVPKAQRIPWWRAMSECFTFHFWVCLLAVFLVTTVVWYVLRRLSEKVSFLTNAVDTMAVFLTMSLSFLTKISALSQRLLIASCLFFSLVVMCLFQSSLLDTVAHPRFQPDIDTLQKLDKTGLPIITLDRNLLDTFNESLALRNLADRLQHQDVSEDALLHQIANHRNACMLTSKGEALWFLGKFPNKLHIVSESPREYFVSYMIPKGSPYATRIHNLLGKMSQAGLVRKWDVDASYRLQLKALREGRANLQDTGNAKVFAFFDFQFSFLVWAVGVAVGTVVFLLERCFA
ncbi:uncharacterized protein LOC110838289 [Zootermopsis nevadensis]|nr:uncharacterized protein LOC110838289 [Zootermopsis nevadensis]